MRRFNLLQFLEQYINIAGSKLLYCLAIRTVSFKFAIRIQQNKEVNKMFVLAQKQTQVELVKKKYSVNNIG